MIPPQNTEVFETPLLDCWFGDDGILYSVSKDAERTMENYSILFDLYRKLSDNGTKKIYSLGNISESQPMTKEVREYVYSETSKYIKAMALVAESSLGKAVGSIFKTLSALPYPLATFNTKEDAVLWLLKIMNKKENTSGESEANEFPDEKRGVI